MNYQNIVCYGDSQTNGARTYTSYPHYLALELEKRDGKLWNVIERAVSGYTAKDLLKMIQMDNIPDCIQACVMIGTNDCKISTDYKVFVQYIHRIDTALRIKGITPIFGKIPRIYVGGGDLPYMRINEPWRVKLNHCLKGAISTDMPPDCYEDAVHFNDKGNRMLAKIFAEAICRR
jgi:lysophospholipase L1-like esterase